MDIFIDPQSSLGLTTQIYEAIRSGIVDGRLAPGDRVPPSRELARALQVSRHTVTTAYGWLSAEGFLEGRSGGGTAVADLVHPALSPREFASPEAISPRTIKPVELDLRPGTPDPRLFPRAAWRRSTQAAVDQHLATYSDPAGDHELRQILARWISRSRGVEASIDDLVVTSGAQHAFYLLVGTCIGPGDLVAMEDPGYNRFRELVEATGATIAPVPVDDEGIVVDAIPFAAKLVYVTPSHQFPTGVTLSMSRRVALLTLAQRQGMVIVEDDYDSELRYTGRPLEPLYRLDRAGSVAYVASFSKVLSPALRLGFVVVPAGIRNRLVTLRERIDWAPPMIEQLALRDFVGAGLLDRHLRRTLRIYQRRFQVAIAILTELSRGGAITLQPSTAGLHVSARLSAGHDEAELIARLDRRGVALGGYSEYRQARDNAAGGLVLGLGLVDEPALTAALTVIAEVLRSS